MARPLIERQREAQDTAGTQRDGWLTRATARAFAAAVSALLIATLVVNRSNEALSSEGTVAGTAIGSGTIALVDDDSGRSLFDLSNMAPGRSVDRCIELVYEGTIVPVDLALLAEGTGQLSSFLDVTIEEGRGGSFETCDGFAAETVVYHGTFADLADSRWLDLGRFLNTGDRRTYRITFDLQDVQAALGQATSVDFVWEVTPS